LVQHRLNALVPGINGPTSFAAIRNADDDLARIRSALNELGLLDTTDIIATSDHGFSTISKESQTSSTTRTRFADTPPGHLPLGFRRAESRTRSQPGGDRPRRDGYKTLGEEQQTKFGNAFVVHVQARLHDVDIGSEVAWKCPERPNRAGEPAAEAVVIVVAKAVVIPPSRHCTHPARSQPASPAVRTGRDERAYPAAYRRGSRHLPPAHRSRSFSAEFATGREMHSRGPRQSLPCCYRRERQ
jgi:hypothetical protein